MKRFEHSGIVAVLATLSLMLSIFAARAEDTVQSVYDAAKTEGKVVFWSSAFVEANNKVAAKFAEHYPGIAVEPFRVDNLQLIQRVMTEAAAGRYDVDVIDLPVVYLAQLIAKGLVESYPWSKVFSIDPALVLFDGAAVIRNQLDLPLAYNTGSVQPGEIKSWEDLTDPKWRGRLIVEGRAQTFYILSLAWGEPRTDDYLREIAANDPTIVVGSASVMEALAGGQAAAAIGAISSTQLQYRERGAPVDWARVGPVPALNYVVLVMKNAPHPKAALLWTAFQLTEDAQKVRWDEDRIGMLEGDAMSPHGKEIQAAGLPLQFESANSDLAGRLIEKYVDMLNGGSK